MSFCNAKAPRNFSEKILPPTDTVSSVKFNDSSTNDFVSQQCFNNQGQRGMSVKTAESHGKGFG